MTDITGTHESVADEGQTRRRFLTAATSAVGVGGVAGVAVPFLGSWNPSEKAIIGGRFQMRHGQVLLKQSDRRHETTAL